MGRVRIMTPLHLEILLHYYISPDPFPRKSATISQYTEDLSAKQLLKQSAFNPTVFKVTERSELWIKRALETPLPVQRWVWEDEEDKG